MTTQAINGHVVDYISHRFECLNCGARLLSIMQFQTRECPKPQIPAARPAGEGRESEALASPFRSPFDGPYAGCTCGLQGNCAVCIEQTRRFLNDPPAIGRKEHERLVREARAEAVEQAAEVFDSLALNVANAPEFADWLRDRAAQHRADKEPT